MSFNEKLQYLRKANKLSQEQLADMLDVTRQSVSKWESGTTYPEMDKLITMCKIFKCSLDDLTNDEITNIDVEKKSSQGNFIGNMVSSIVGIIEDTIKMFSSMSARKIIGVIASLFILGCFLIILRIPFEVLENGMRNVLLNLPNRGVAGSISGLFNLVFDIVFFALYVLAFMYIYKRAYLDKYATGEVSLVKKTSCKNEIEEKKEEIKDAKIINESGKKENTLFYFLGNIVIWFFRIMAGFCLVPFVFTLVLLFATLVISVVLTFDGVVFVGVILGLIFAIILNVWLLEVGSVFIFNKHSSFRRLLWTFLVGLAGIGISIGIVAMEISGLDYVEEFPSKFNKVTVKEEYAMSDDFTVYEAYWYGRELVYVEDDSLKDKVLIEVEHYDVMNKPIIKKEEEIVSINVYYEETFGKNKHMWELLKDDLRKKQLRDYSELHRVVIKISSDEKNIKRIKENSKKYLEEIYQKESHMYEYQLEFRIKDYEKEIEDLIAENEELKERVEELEEYKERVQGAIE